MEVKFQTYLKSDAFKNLKIKEPLPPPPRPEERQEMIPEEYEASKKERPTEQREPRREELLEQEAPRDHMPTDHMREPRREELLEQGSPRKEELLESPMEMEPPEIIGDMPAGAP